VNDPSSHVLLELIQRTGMTVEEAAEELEIDLQDLRAYCSGQRRAPRYIGLALLRVVDLRETTGRKTWGVLSKSVPPRSRCFARRHDCGSALSRSAA
jgi:hypothetical protein